MPCGVKNTQCNGYFGSLIFLNMVTCFLVYISFAPYTFLLTYLLSYSFTA